MATRSKFGEYTEELLQLNEETQLEFRKTTLHLLRMATKELASLIDQSTQLKKSLNQNLITQKDHDDAASEISDEIKATQILIQNYTGKKPLPPLKNKRFGIALS